MTPVRPRPPLATASVVPTLRFERSLLRSGAPLLACVDEVGRGALAGPVSVGVVLVELGTRSAPQGLRDSKLLTPSVRQALAPKLRRWVSRNAVGHASADEIDQVGIIAALRVAAARAFGQLDAVPNLALLDGNHNYLAEPAVPEGLFPDPRHAQAWGLADLSLLPARVVTRIKADLTCAGVAAASVLAKCERDSMMVELASTTPGYGWEHNMGYGAPEHVGALRTLGPSPLHRRSWRLPLEAPVILPQGGAAADQSWDEECAAGPGADERAESLWGASETAGNAAPRLSTASA